MLLGLRLFRLGFAKHGFYPRREEMGVRGIETLWGCLRDPEQCHSGAVGFTLSVGSADALEGITGSWPYLHVLLS